MRAAQRESGQASAELVAAIPVLLALLLALLQIVLIGYALWSAGAAARAGARAVFVGGNVERAARSAVPEALERGASVAERGGAVEVTVRAPALIPGLPHIPLHASAGFDPAAGG